jgi:acyl-CoA thioesterase
MNASPDPFSILLGFELLELGPGFARVRGTVGPDHTNQHGSAHGGFVFALADTAFAVASNSHGPVAVAVATSIHFTKAAMPGEALVAEATEESLSPRMATYSVTVRRGEEVVAVFTGTVHRRALEGGTRDSA